MVKGSRRLRRKSPALDFARLASYQGCMILSPSRIVIGIFWLLGPGPASAQPTSAPAEELQNRVDALTALANPTKDDWPTEAWQSRAKHRLQDLAEAMIQRFNSKELLDKGLGCFSPDARIANLRPAGGQVSEVPGWRVRRLALADIAALPSGPPEAGSHFIRLPELLKGLGSGPALHVVFKIISISPLSNQRFTTTVLVEIASGHEGAAIQRNATWDVDWLGESTTADPLITGIRLTRYEEATTNQPTFVDATRAVITDAATWHPHLSHGSDYWHGRLDAIGEMNLMGHEGLAIGDVNGDGLDDLYVALGNGLPNKLFIQQIDGTVHETAHQAGVDWLDATKGVLLVDLDNDGDQDLLCAIGPTIVYCQNDGSGRFTPTRSLKAGSPASFYSLAVADYDQDGDLDIYACRYVKQRYGLSVPMPLQDANNGPSNHLLRNDGPEGFVDVTRVVGLGVNNRRFSLSATWIDYDQDGDVDLYVANDFGRNNLYRNDEGRFTDVADQAGVEDQAAGMGVTWSDFDLDGDFDLYVSNMYSSAGRRIATQQRFMANDAPDDRLGVYRHSLGNTLLVNAGDGSFGDHSDDAGVRMGRWAWGSLFADINNDAFDDLIVPNGFLTNDYKDDL